METNSEWTVQLTLLGRRDGRDIGGIGSVSEKGSFSSYTEAREALAAWERDETFIFKARAHYRGDR